MRKEKLLEVNWIDTFGILLIVAGSLVIQLVLHDLPCPLCLLQRWGFLGIAFGLLLNLRFGIRSSHYAVALLCTLFTATVALRQILLHIVPGTGAYGPAIFGLHLYTWVFIFCVLLLLFITFMFLFDEQFRHLRVKSSVRMQKWISFIFVIAILVTLANTVTVFIECGFKTCPDNPTQYKF